MKNLRISGKLLVSFTGIGLLLVALGWFAIAELGSINGLMNLAVRDRLPKVITVDEMNTATSDFRIAEAQHILSLDPASMEAAETKITAQKELIERDYKDMDGKLHIPRARALLGQFRNQWNAYLSQDQALLALSRQNKNAEATALMRGRSQQLFDEAARTIGDLATFEADTAKAAGETGDALYGRAWYLVLLAVMAALVGLGAVLTVLVRQIARPVSAATQALGQLAQGRMDVTVPDSDRADEVGDLAKALTGLRDQLDAAERSKAEQTTLIVDSIGRGLSGLAGGDLVSRVDADLTGPFAKLKTDFNDAASSLQSTVTQVAKAAAEINGGAGEVRTASDDLSQRTEQQAASLEETAAAMDEITATVRSTAERASSANAAVRGARDEAEKSGEVVRGAVAAMGGIERTSNEISEIISVIDGIAFQTNLLALNAGVEAARAGDAGKGFAVVASEVRALAQRSADAAKDVKARITASGEQVATGVKLVGQTGEALTRIIGRIGEIDGLVSEIASAAEQQATGLQQVNTAVSEMDGVTQQNAAMVEEATAAARSLAAEAEGLIRQIARFRTGAEPAAPASPVHQLQARAASAARKPLKPAHRSFGNAALAVSDEWSEF